MLYAYQGLRGVRFLCVGVRCLSQEVPDCRCLSAKKIKKGEDRRGFQNLDAIRMSNLALLSEGLFSFKVLYVSINEVEKNRFSFLI